MSRNLPNQITISRLVLAVIFFVLLAQYDAAAPTPWLLDVCFWVFIVAASTDFVDGYLARKYNAESALGRILDPFVDKVLLGGAFVFYAGAGFVDGEGRNVTGVTAWMVVVIFGRELLVTGLRGVSEAQGAAFGANLFGKIKMWCQSIAVGWVMMSLAHKTTTFAHWFWQDGRVVAVYIAVIVTVLSMTTYLRQAYGVLRAPSGA